MKEKRTTKSRWGLLLCVFAALFMWVLPALVAAGDSAGQTINVGVPKDRCPIFYIHPDTNEITGIGVDLMRLAAEKAGCEVAFRTIEEKNLKDALDNPAYDAVMPFGGAVASTSGLNCVLSENLMQTPFTLVTEGSRPLPPLNSLRVGMLSSRAAVAETLQRLYPGMKITLFETTPDGVEALRSGAVDGLLNNSYVWSYVLQKPAYRELAVQPGAVISMDFRAGAADTPKGREIIARLDEGIRQLSDTQRQAVILDHTSRRLYRYDFSDYLHQYGMVILAAVLLMILVAAAAMQRIWSVRESHEEKMRRMMDYDPLTGVYNMNGFRKRVEELLRTYPDTPYFLSYNNIRDFKFINDSLGRDAGDALLRFWMECSRKLLSETEEAIGRIDADHFAVLRHISGEDRMREDEENVFTPVHDFFIKQGKDYRVQVCTGVYVLSPKDFRKIDVDHMLDLARVAEKRVRESRKGTMEFYNPDQWDKGKKIAEIINYLPAAINAGNLQVWYQPQVNYETKRVTGAEALCRWDHTKLGWLYPYDFIETLEEAGLIFDLDCFVWDRVCQDLHRWNEEGKHKTVSVNVSRDDIREDRDIPAHFLNLTEKYQLTPDQLHIEITETAYVENTDLLISTTEKLRSSGFQVEMDDFGSGYSSLHMLKEVPVDRIKMDLHFLTADGDAEKSRIIIRNITRMISELGMNMIAEGVESAAQADFLKSIGCAEMQGYYFFKPLPVREFEKISGSI